MDKLLSYGMIFKKKGFEWTFTTSFEEKKEPLKVMFLYWNINLQKYRIKIDI